MKLRHHILLLDAIEVDDANVYLLVTDELDEVTAQGANAHDDHHVFLLDSVGA